MPDFSTPRLLLALHINKCLIIKFQLNDNNKIKMFWRQINFSEIVFRAGCLARLGSTWLASQVSCLTPSICISYLFSFCMLNNCRHRWGDDKNKQSRPIHWQSQKLQAPKPQISWLVAKTNFLARVSEPPRKLLAIRIYKCFLYFFSAIWGAPPFMFNDLNMFVCWRCGSSFPDTFFW